ncbi:cytochrome P450 [Myxococcus sp. RHSTA-1-4]|uniref:cytochrome P450 n=1 Tax=Myxococcus sp. RHSTA-1-4 TaxID=2874601 RepID=UPI001CBCDED5|nr:cytochrome P450 [Myxococcus sp. RHSTA-1-4]MBZ4423132.1 cytochrome P450 [Myxococcus sp. RHSTA-1-4]
MSPPRLPPGPSLSSLIWHMVTTGGDLNSFLEKTSRRYGEVATLPFPGKVHYLISSPNLIKHFLVDQGVMNYPKEPIRRGIVAGEALSSSSGAFWKRHRRMSQPAFQRDRLLSQVPRMVGAVQRVLDQRWEPFLRSGAPMDVLREMSWTVITLMGQLVFSEDPTDELRDAVWYFMRSSIRPRPLVAEVPFLVPRAVLRWDHRRRNPRALESARRLNDFAWETVRRRMAQAEQPEDMLGVLIDARDEKGEPMTEQEVRDELVEFFFAGHSSTGIGLAWLWYCLALNPEITERTAETVGRVLGGRAPTADDLPALQYVSQVFSETLRIHPPAAELTRIAIKDDTIGGFDVPVGTRVTMSPHVMHRIPEYWKDAETFDPERFSEEQVQARPRFVYLPFGGGQRVCIGMMLASVIGTLVTSMVLQRYRLELVPGRKVVPSTGGTHYPVNLWMKVLPAMQPVRSGARVA